MVHQCALLAWRQLALTSAALSVDQCPGMYPACHLISTTAHTRRRVSASTMGCISSFCPLEAPALASLLTVICWPLTAAAAAAEVPRVHASHALNSAGATVHVTVYNMQQCCHVCKPHLHQSPPSASLQWMRCTEHPARTATTAEGTQQAQPAQHSTVQHTMQHKSLTTLATDEPGCTHSPRYVTLLF